MTIELAISTRDFPKSSRESFFGHREWAVLNPILRAHDFPSAKPEKRKTELSKIFSVQVFDKISVPLRRELDAVVSVNLYLNSVTKWWIKMSISSLASSFPGQACTPRPKGTNVLGLGATCIRPQPLKILSTFYFYSPILHTHACLSEPEKRKTKRQKHLTARACTSVFVDCFASAHKRKLCRFYSITDVF